MNARQLEKLGIPRECVPFAISAIQRILASNSSRQELEGGGKSIKKSLQAISDSPEEFQLGGISKGPDRLPTRGFEAPFASDCLPYMG